MEQGSGRPIRDGGGRFVPGQSGNPRGKAPGTRNRATLLREVLRDGDETTIVQKLIDRARDGDSVAARFVIDGLAPKSRHRPITLDVPGDADAATIGAAALKAMLTSEISPQEMASVMDAVLRGAEAVWGVEKIARSRAALRQSAAIAAALTAAAGLAPRPARAPSARSVAAPARRRVAVPARPAPSQRVSQPAPPETAPSPVAA